MKTVDLSGLVRTAAAAITGCIPSSTRFAFVAMFSIVAQALSSCSTIVAVQEPSRLFHPYVSDVRPAFQVIDRRPSERRTSHQVDSSWYYGDEQFSPTAVQVVADRFAQAFPTANVEATLVVTEIEVRYDLARVGDFGQGCSVLLLDCLVTPIIAANEHRRRNVVSVRLSGVFDGISFRDGEDAEYVDHMPDRQEYRVLSALQAAIDKALTDVHNRLPTH